MQYQINRRTALKALGAAALVPALASCAEDGGIPKAAAAGTPSSGAAAGKRTVMLGGEARR